MGVESNKQKNDGFWTKKKDGGWVERTKKNGFWTKKKDEGWVERIKIKSWVLNKKKIRFERTVD